MYEGPYYNCKCGHVNRASDRECVKCGLAEAPAPPPGSPSNSSVLLAALRDAVYERRETHAAYCSFMAGRAGRSPTMEESKKEHSLRSILGFSERTILQIADQLADIGS